MTTTTKVFDMPIVNEIQGDLIELAKAGEFDAIVHGCNCFHAMGAGIARSIAQEFPEAYKADCETTHGEYGKLGDFSICVIDRFKEPFHVINAYTQYDMGRDGSYHAIKKVFQLINKIFKGQNIGIPLIGCGIAGLEWASVRAIIDKECPDVDICVVHYRKDIPLNIMIEHLHS